LLLAVLLLWIFHPGQASAPEPAVQLHPPKPDGLTSHILFVGDVFWGRRVQKSAEASGQGYSYLTSKLSKADRANYDAWIANFECPITTRDVPYEQQTDLLRFNCRPEYLPNLAKWFTAASQANNHEDNNGGSWGLDQTRKNLQEAGIQYFSTYDMTDPADLCEVITVPAKTTISDKTVSLPIAMCGFMYVVDQTPTDAQLAVMRQYAKVMPVIAYPHMGVEYRTTGEPEKVSAYHRMINDGADMVVGAHPHVIQNSESYKGKLIAYSVGNFLFDQQIQGRNTTLGLGVGLKLTIKDAKAAKIYEQVAPSCKAYKDDCLAKLRTQFKTRPKIDVSYNFACYDESRAVGSLPQLGDRAACNLADNMATVDQLGNLSKQW
jgi:poly-gamma-glutamate synthesis protein (capsule biosynthesis protein)